MGVGLASQAQNKNRCESKKLDPQVVVFRSRSTRTPYVRLKTKGTVPLQAVAGIALLLKTLPVRTYRLSGDLRLIRSASCGVIQGAASLPLGCRFEYQLMFNIIKSKLKKARFHDPSRITFGPMAKSLACRVGKITLAYRTERFDVRRPVSPSEIAGFWHSEYWVYKRGTRPSAHSKKWITAPFSVRIHSLV